MPSKECKANIVVFDSETVQDRANLIQPHRYSTEIASMIINRKLNIENGKSSASLNGRVLLTMQDKRY